MRLRIVLLALALTLVLQSFVSAGWYFDGRYKSIGSTIRGVKSSISTAPDPDLHGGNLSCVWCMVSNNLAGASNRYAQAGYTFEPGVPNTKQVFAQWKHTDGSMDEEKKAAPSGGAHTYKCVQDNSTKRWTFYYDGTVIAHPFNTNWDGSWVKFFGEVAPNTSVQMMGDANPVTDKVKFTTFRYLPPGCTTWTTVWPSSSKNDNSPDWSLYSVQAEGYFKIWDNNP